MGFSSFGEWLVAVTISLIGIALLALSVAFVWKQSADFGTAPGKVVGFTPERQGAKIAFSHAQNAVQFVVQGAAHSYQVGDRVTVLYQYNRPDNAVIYSFVNQWGASFLLFILSVPFLFLAYSLWLRIITSPRTAYHS